MKRRSSLLPALTLCAILAGCGDPDPVPKPRGYFRIDLPPQEYVPWLEEGAMAMEVPANARMVKRREEAGSRWYDLRYPDQRATVHLTWTPVQGQLMDLITDAHAFRTTHEARAARMGVQRIRRPEQRVFGNIYHAEGDVASPLVFYLTDSTDNFLYGALYYDVRPNADSLAPVTQRIREDVAHFVGTLEWR
jgi:gliding motility-associated lipoprotein GldD